MKKVNRCYQNNRNDMLQHKKTNKQLRVLIFILKYFYAIGLQQSIVLYALTS